MLNIDCRSSLIWNANCKCSYS